MTGPDLVALEKALDEVARLFPRNREGYELGARLRDLRLAARGKAEPAEAHAASLYLYASCSAENYGRILGTGKDANGRDVMDVEVFDPQDLIITTCDCGEDPCEHYNLMRMELPSGVRPILRDVPYRDKGDGRVELETPGDGCYRCAKLFSVVDDAGLPASILGIEHRNASGTVSTICSSTGCHPRFGAWYFVTDFSRDLDAPCSCPSCLEWRKSIQEVQR